jgi:hypothetical protein
MAMSTKMAVFWDVAPCSLVDTDWCFRGAYSFNPSRLWWRQYAPLKCQSVSTTPQCTSQKTAIWAIFNFLQFVIPTSWMLKLVRWEDDPPCWLMTNLWGGRMILHAHWWLIASYDITTREDVTTYDVHLYACNNPNTAQKIVMKLGIGVNAIGRYSTIIILNSLQSIIPTWRIWDRQGGRETNPPTTTTLTNPIAIQDHSEETKFTSQ